MFSASVSVRTTGARTAGRWCDARSRSVERSARPKTSPLRSLSAFAAVTSAAPLLPTLADTPSPQTRHRIPSHTTGRMACDKRRTVTGEHQATSHSSYAPLLGRRIGELVQQRNRKSRHQARCCFWGIWGLSAGPSRQASVSSAAGSMPAASSNDVGSGSDLRVSKPASCAVALWRGARVHRCQAE